MNKLFNKKIFSKSNIIFIIVLGLIVYPPSREWVQRQLAFAPSVKEVDDTEKISSYNWKLSGLNTQDINFNQFENKVIFVNFWATWCPPCRAEMPIIQELYDEYKDKIEFVFVTNENWGTVEKYFNEKGYNLPTYNSIGIPPKSFTETNSIPATYLIDRNGNILVSKTGAANWSSEKFKKRLDKLILE